MWNVFQSKFEVIQIFNIKSCFDFLQVLFAGRRMSCHLLVHSKAQLVIDISAEGSLMSDRLCWSQIQCTLMPFLMKVIWCVSSTKQKAMQVSNIWKKAKNLHLSRLGWVSWTHLVSRNVYSRKDTHTYPTEQWKKNYMIKAKLDKNMKTPIYLNDKKPNILKSLLVLNHSKN